MHVENELVEIVTTDDREFEEIIEEYEEEILVQDRAPEPFIADSIDTSACPRQAPVHNPYFEWSLDIYMWCAFTL